MYFGHLNNPDLNYLHKNIKTNNTFKYTNMTSNNLFKLIEHGDYVEVNPLFYYDKVEVSDPNAVIRQNNIIITKDDDTTFTFTSTQKIKDVQVYTKKVSDFYLIYILNEWCKGLHDIPVRVTTTECDDMEAVSLEATTLLTEDYLGDFDSFYDEPIETTDYNSNTDGLITYITTESTIYIEITINDKKYCFKTGGESE